MSSTDYSGTRNTVAVDPEEILSAWNREILSAQAIKLYEGVWHRMRLRGSPAVWLTDEEISRRSRLLIQHVPGARQELINSNLLECEQGDAQWLYRYVEQTGPEFDLESGAGQ